MLVDSLVGRIGCRVVSIADSKVTDWTALSNRSAYETQFGQQRYLFSHKSQMSVTGRKGQVSPGFRPRY